MKVIKKIVQVKLAKPYATNDGNHNRSAGNTALISIGGQTINIESECEYDTWYEKTVQLTEDASGFTVSEGAWSAVAIEEITVSQD